MLLMKIKDQASYSHSKVFLTQRLSVTHQIFSMKAIPDFVTIKPKFMKSISTFMAQNYKGLFYFTLQRHLK